MKIHYCLTILCLYCPIAMGQAQHSQMAVDYVNTDYANNPWSQPSVQPLYRGDVTRHTPLETKTIDNPWQHNVNSTPQYRPLEGDGGSVNTYANPNMPAPSYENQTFTMSRTPTPDDTMSIDSSYPPANAAHDYYAYRAQNWRPHSAPQSPVYPSDLPPQYPTATLANPVQSHTPPAAATFSPYGAQPFNPHAQLYTPPTGNGQSYTYPSYQRWSPWSNSNWPSYGLPAPEASFYWNHALPQGHNVITAPQHQFK